MFLAKDRGVVAHEDAAEAMGEGVETQETVKRVKRTPPPARR
jgi:hypothetical protein